MNTAFRTVAAFARDYKIAAFCGVIVLLFALTGIFAPWISPKDPNQISVRNTLEPPGKEFLLGADNNGRDLLSRIIAGARVSLYIGAASVGAAGLVGTALGVLAAWYPRLDTIIMRLMDVLLAFPGIVVALTIVSVLGRGVENVVVAITIYQVPQFARLAHGLTLSVKEKTFIEAAVATGESDLAILNTYVLPNILAPLVVQFSLLIPGAIMTAASLSFVGLGVQPPQAEWGAMLQGSLTWARLAPHLVIYPGLTLMIVVLAFNVLGDGLRDFMDPRLKRR